MLLNCSTYRTSKAGTLFNPTTTDNFFESVSTKIPPLTGLQEAPNFLGIYLSDVVGITKY
jgi:hypothetical protein